MIKTIEKYKYCTKTYDKAIENDKYFNKMKVTEVQTLGTPTSVRSLAHNNYLLLGVVTQHMESELYEKCRKIGLNEKVACCLLH